jgi:hypothetical protein
MYEYFYHSITKKAVVAFGSLFNDIYIARFDSSGNETERVRVPLSYMTKQKFISRLNQDPSLNSPFYMSLPRMSFEFSNLIYDSSRKNDSFQKSLSQNNSIYSFRYGRVPYNMTFMLHIFAKNTDDALQIMEQIIPFFTPEYSVNVKMVDPTDLSVDLPFVIQNITYDEDNEDTNFENRKTVIVDIEFYAKLFYYGPTKQLSFGATGGTGFGAGVQIPEGMIGKVVIDFFGGTTGDILSGDSDLALQTIETGLTGNVSPDSFSLTATNQSYIVYGKA